MRAAQVKPFRISFKADQNEAIGSVTANAANENENADVVRDFFFAFP